MINTKSLEEFINDIMELYSNYFKNENNKKTWTEQYKMAILDKAHERRVNYSKLLRNVMDNHTSMTTPPAPAKVVEQLYDCYMNNSGQIGKSRFFKHEKSGVVVEFVEVDWYKAPTKEQIVASGYIEI